LLGAGRNDNSLKRVTGGVEGEENLKKGVHIQKAAKKKAWGLVQERENWGMKRGESHM